MFQKILIANRGEIACRIIRTARRLGIRTVAVYSAADADALHVALADEAHFIGPGPARESYLCGQRILDTARACGAQAIHPGYGFLSENADFAESCERAGIAFVGPPAAVIRAAGDKTRAKRVMQEAGVPIVPGYHGDQQNVTSLAREARNLGYPVIIKAAAGGGGRGMRVVHDASSFVEAAESARREADAAFADGRLIVEKYIADPRHIEVQVFGDAHGNVVHLFERDCSLQRRHQKIIEEAPAPGLADDLRRALCQAAFAAARATAYVGAGTVEFLVHERAFYFIEMNTRLQVEHPVTEMVTGHDLVEWQLRVAAGQAIPVTQDEIRIRGHAVEARLYAEDPERDFLPASGRLTLYRLPAPGPDLRVETGVAEGDVIPVFYDALLAKLIGWGEDREAALRRLDAALAATRLAGIANNRDVLLRLVRHPSIISGGVGTGFIGQERAALLPASAPAPFAVLAAASLFVLHEEAAGAARTAAASDDPYSPWQTRDGWRLFEPSEYALRWMDAGVERHLQVGLLNGGYRMTLDGAGSDARLISVSGSALTFEFNSVRRTVAVVRDRDEFTVITEADSWKLRRADPSARPGDVEESLGRLTAPMHGTVLDVAVVPGSNVRRGERLMLLECMKLEYAIVAPADAVVETVHCAAGDIVEEGATLLVLSSSQPG